MDYTLRVSFTDEETLPSNIGTLPFYGMTYARTVLTFKGTYRPEDEDCILVTMKDGELWADPDDMYPLFGEDAEWEIITGT